MLLPISDHYNWQRHPLANEIMNWNFLAILFWENMSSGVQIVLNLFSWTSLSLLISISARSVTLFLNFFVSVNLFPNCLYYMCTMWSYSDHQMCDNDYLVPNFDPLLGTKKLRLMTKMQLRLSTIVDGLVPRCLGAWCNTELLKTDAD
jgi:hypothetical protein